MVLVDSSSFLFAIQVEGFPREATDCSTTGAGQLVTKLVNLKITNGEPQTLHVTFEIPVS